ncbi:USP8 dimerization domain-containing protein [Ditylenchus destructor]|nr:USP8 dimerization domain-containing protein [Ditylenchus destructor]
MDNYMQILNNIFQMGTFYAREGDEEKAFVLFLRYVSIAVEELPNHNVYSTMSGAQQLEIDAKIIEAMANAEYFKSNLRRRFEKEANEAISKKDSNAGASQANGASSNDTKILSNPSLQEWGISAEKLSPYVLCNEASVHPIVFLRIIIPNDLPQSFLKSTEGAPRFAFLYGKLVRNSLIVSHLLMPTTENGHMEKFERFLADSGTENDMPIIGCICGSVVDALHFFEHCQLSELICIVCPQGPNRSFVLHLVNMPSAHSKSNQLKHSSWTGCSHLHITDSISSTVVSNQKAAPSVV